MMAIVLTIFQKNGAVFLWIVALDGAMNIPTATTACFGFLYSVEVTLTNITEANMHAKWTNGT
jgi:hypothetical protein